jgi:hypothetical protein
MATDRSFRRIVLGLEPNAPAHCVHIAVDVAQFLSANLSALFVEEQALVDLATMPFSREFRPSSGWQPIEPDRLFREMDALAKAAERSFAAATRSLRGGAEFKVVRGSAVEILSAQTGAGDLLILSEPKQPAHAPEHFLALFAAARQSASAVMIVPRRVARRQGVVVVVPASDDDPAIAVASAIAAAAREDIVSIGGQPALASPAEIAATFSRVRERLVVISGAAFDPSVPLRIAASRKVPVLVIDHGGA